MVVFPFPVPMNKESAQTLNQGLSQGLQAWMKGPSQQTTPVFSTNQGPPPYCQALLGSGLDCRGWSAYSIFPCPSRVCTHMCILNCGNAAAGRSADKEGSLLGRTDRRF